MRIRDRTQIMAISALTEEREQTSILGTLEKIRQRKHIVRAAVYARFSSDNQRDESIDAQLRAIKEYAVKNDVTIVGEYIDRAVSGTTDNRPDFLRMISDAEKNLFDVVLVHKLDRFARNRQDSIGYRMELKKHDVSLVSVLEYLDEDSPESVILESVLEAMAEYYSKNLAREVNKGMKENALKCKHTGGIPPLGYDVDPQSKLLVINEGEAEIVRLIFKYFLEGKGYKQISSDLNSAGYHTKVGRKFSTNSIYTILRNEKYKGTYVFNKSSSKSTNGTRNSHLYKTGEDVIRIENGVPAIIPKEEFDAVEERLMNRVFPTTSKRIETYLLSGKIICGECGSAYVGNRKYSGRNKTLHVTYRCNGRYRKINCSNKEIRREYIENFVINKLSEFVFDDRLIPVLTKEYKSYQLEKNNKIFERRDNFEKRIKELSREISNIVTVIANTASIALAEKLTEMESEKAQMLTKLKQIEDDCCLKAVEESEIAEAFKTARKLLANRNLSTLQKLIDVYVDRVIVFKDRVEVFFNFTENFVYPQYEVKNVSHTADNKINYVAATCVADDGGGEGDNVSPFSPFPIVSECC